MPGSLHCLSCGAPLSAPAKSPFCPRCQAQSQPDLAVAVTQAPVPRESAVAELAPPQAVLDTNIRTVRVQAPAAFALWGPEDIASLFPQLEILEVIGRGGMGVVYKARQAELERLVALKVLLPSASPDPAFSERFLREARALARLKHPHIVTVYEIGRSGDLCYLIMEYVDGPTLRQLIQSGSLTEKRALEIVIDVCSALQYAHDERIVHRDVKPDNILVEQRGGAKIADFGIAKLAGRTPTEVALTNSRQVMGTMFYMAPEQFERPRAVDQRADIYSLGVVLYEAVTGELPLGRFDSPSKKVVIDPRLDRIILQSLEKQPERRYQRVIELQQDLEECLRLPPVAPEIIRHETTVVQAPPASPTTTPEQIVRAPSMGLLLSGGLTSVGLIVFTGIFLGLAIGELSSKQAGLVTEVWRRCWWMVLGTLPGPLLFLAGRRLERLCAQRFILVACGVGMLTTIVLPSPFNLLNFPLGLWGMLTVVRQDVKSAFTRHAEPDRWGRLLLLTAVGCVALLGCVLAVFYR